MAYCTVDDVINNHEKIPDDNYISEIESFIDDADGIIDSYLASKYTLPFAMTPKLVKYISRSIATYFTLRYLFSAEMVDMQEWIKDFYDRPMALLVDIRDCKLDLSDATAEKVMRVQSNTKDKVPIFNLGDVYSQSYHPEEDDERYGVVE